MPKRFEPLSEWSRIQSGSEQRPFQARGYAVEKSPLRRSGGRSPEVAIIYGMVQHTNKSNHFEAESSEDFFTRLTHRTLLVSNVCAHLSVLLWHWRKTSVRASSPS